MDAADLKVFEAVARLGGMNRAAVELNTVQSNITARIQALEADIGSMLLERHSRGVTLTQAGQRLLPYADKVARLLDDARRAARDDGAPRGVLTIGSLETTAALRLTPLLTRYATDNPAVDLVLRTGTTCEMVGDVLEQRVDGAFVCGPVAHPELEEQVMFREELVVLAAPGVASLECRADHGRGARSSCSARAVPIVRCCRRCWRGAASWCSACWSSARWRRSSAVSAPASASRCCRAHWWAACVMRGASACTRCRRRTRW